MNGRFWLAQGAAFSLLLLLASVSLTMRFAPGIKVHRLERAADGVFCQDSLTVAIATKNRFQHLHESVVQYARSDYVSQVVVSDEADSSDYERLQQWLTEGVAGLSARQTSKILLAKSATKLGATRNKVKALSLASSPWVALMDSDNLAGDDSYFARVCAAWRADPSRYHEQRTIYAPERLVGTSLDYTAHRLAIGDVTRATWNLHRSLNTGNGLLNTGNYVVPRRLVDVWTPHAATDPQPFGQDTMLMNLVAIRANYSIQIVEGMAYHHRMSEDSLWSNTAQASMAWMAEHAAELDVRG